MTEKQDLEHRPQVKQPGNRIQCRICMVKWPCRAAQEKIAANMRSISSLELPRHGG